MKCILWFFHHRSGYIYYLLPSPLIPLTIVTASRPISTFSMNAPTYICLQKKNIAPVTFTQWLAEDSHVGFIPHDFRCGICGIPLRYHRCELRATNHAEYRKFTATTATSFTATYRNKYEYFHCFFYLYRESYYSTTLFRLKKIISLNLKMQ